MGFLITSVLLFGGIALLFIFAGAIAEHGGKIGGIISKIIIIAFCLAWAAWGIATI